MKRLGEIFVDAVLIVAVAAIGVSVVPTTQYLARVATESPSIPPEAYQVDVESVAMELEP